MGRPIAREMRILLAPSVCLAFAIVVGCRPPSPPQPPRRPDLPAPIPAPPPPPPIPAPPRLSPELESRYRDLLQEDPIREDSVLFSVENAFNRSEEITFTLGTRPIEGKLGVPLRMEEQTVEHHALTGKPTRTLTCTVASDEVWDALAEFLHQRAGLLLKVTEEDPARSSACPFPVTTLAFFVPRARLLELGNRPIRLSANAQQHLRLAARSNYQAPRHVVLIEEPHHDVGAQYALFKGLEALFDENPWLLRDGVTVFLAEGVPAGERLSVEPLVNARPDPSPAVVRTILATHLIPGYLAFNWAHAGQIPVVGAEDPALYAASARLWCDVQSGAPGSRLPLCAQAVAARNLPMARALLGHWGTHGCPILFVGREHLRPLVDEGGPQGAAHPRPPGTSGTPTLDPVKPPSHRSIPELLEERDMGYYILRARGNPWPDATAEREAVKQYAALLRAQLSDAPTPAVAGSSPLPGSVSITPSPEAAARAIPPHDGPNEEPDHQQHLQARLKDLLTKIRGSVQSLQAPSSNQTPITTSGPPR